MTNTRLSDRKSSLQIPCLLLLRLRYDRSKVRNRHRTLPSFWDNLSRQILIPRALKEFDRRTIKYHPPIPPQPPSLRSGRNCKDLKRFARLGGPSLADLRGYHRAVSLNSEDRSGSASLGDMAKSRLDAAFEVHLVDNCIFINNSDVKPANRDEIIAKLAAHRPELEESSLTEERFQRFQACNKAAYHDATIRTTVLPIVTGESNTIAANTTTANDLSFCNLKNLTDGSLTKPVSTFCDGLLPAQIDLQIREDLGCYIVPSKNPIVLCLPNFFLEGVEKEWDVAQRRGCYCGALGARGVYKLRSYVDPDTALDNKAYTIVATFHKEGSLKLFTIHPTQFRNDVIAYHMTVLGTFIMTDELESFRKGVRALRNARNWAMEQRENLANTANARRRAALPAL